MPCVHLLVNYMPLFHHVLRLLALSGRISSPPLVILQKVRGVVDVINENATHLTNLITWVWSYGEVALLYAGDLIYFICERSQRFQQKNH
jgi:hypothetical protein